jgi:hypothetical protein
VTEENPTDAENDERHMSQVSLVVYNIDDSQIVLGSYASTTVENGFFYLEKFHPEMASPCCQGSVHALGYIFKIIPLPRKNLTDSYISFKHFPPAFFSVRENCSNSFLWCVM